LSYGCLTEPARGLEFGGCLCSEEYSEFKAVSENALFAYDEGLPRQGLGSGHPVILTEFATPTSSAPTRRSKPA
jgi:hypothetical protein